MHFRTINSMSQRCVAPQVSAGQLCCARLTQRSAAGRINALRSSPQFCAARFVCMASRGAPMLERSDMQQPSNEQAVRQSGDMDRLQTFQNNQNLLESAMSSEASGHLDPSRIDVHKSRMMLGFDRGVWVAAGLITAWASMIHITVFHTPLDSLQAVLLFWPMMQLHTGVFITAHDAMHGAVAPSNPKLNQFMGRLAGTLYAGLDYDSMKKAHHEHHAHTGLQKKDPDFHSGNPGVFPWAGKFIKKYLTIKQMVILNLMVGAVQISGAPYKNMVIFLLCAGLLSAVQLFYFGTYVPHKPPKDDPQQVMNWERSNPTWATTRLASFMTCYHFDCHVEHHSNPRLAWYELWGARKQTLESERQNSLQPEKQ